MVWNIPLGSLDQLSWLCPLSTFFHLPTYLLQGSRVRNREGLDTGQTWMSNSNTVLCYKHGVFFTPMGSANSHPPGHLVVWSRREAMLGWPLSLRIVRAAAHGGPRWSRILAETTAYGEKPMKVQVFWQALWPVGDPCWNSLFLKDCTLWKGSTLQQFVEN